MGSSDVTIKKSLGQHFLRDENICRKIISILKEEPVLRLLEVGPGAGALTRYLLQWEEIEFKAVEVDEEKITYLLHEYPSLQGRLVHADFLRMAIPFEGAFSIVGNFPYNISSQILFKIVEWKSTVQWMVGMFQKEVAQRVAASAGNKVYGVLSVLVQAYFEVEYLFEVSEHCFYPPPKVKSAVIRLRPRKIPLIARSDEDFFRLVKAAFNQRRKTLRNATKHLFSMEFLREEIFGSRAEQLTVEEFGKLTFKMR
jgi:16S rRNA (adenine1518-N6/adenine1519-N6)-dimethyltransferase